MITLYRAAECAACDEIQETLRELVVAHQVVDVAQAAPNTTDHSITNQDVPRIADGERVISGAAELRAYLAELTHDLEQWRKYQTDACYIDDKGKTC